MSTNVRQEALAVLAELAALAPEVRLGQLMAHLGFLGEDQAGRSLWEIEDDELLAALIQHRTELLAHRHLAPNQALPQTRGAGYSPPLAVDGLSESGRAQRETASRVARYNLSG